MLGQSMLRCIYVLVEECYVMLGEIMLRCIYWWRREVEIRHGVNVTQDRKYTQCIYQLCVCVCVCAESQAFYIQWNL